MKTKVIINTKTNKVEFEEAFRERYRHMVSFNGELTKDVVIGLEPDSVLQELLQRPKHDERYQIYFLSEPFEANGTIMVRWIIKGKNPDELNTYLNTQVEDFIDSKAVEKGYKSQDRMIGYIGDPNPVLDREGRFMRDWRSSVWNIVIPRIESFLETLESPDFKPISLSDLIKDVPAFAIPEGF